MTTTYENSDTQKRIPLRQRFAHDKKALTRMLVMSALALISMMVSFLTLPHYIGKVGFWQAILEAFAGCGMLFLSIGFLWSFILWIRMVAPKSLGCANRMWRGWITFTFLGLYLKSVLWLLVTAVPCMIFGLLFSPLYTLGFKLATGNLNLFTALGMFLLGTVLLAIPAGLDACKLLQCSVKELLTDKLRARK